MYVVNGFFVFVGFNNLEDNEKWENNYFKFKVFNWVSSFVFYLVNISSIFFFKKVLLGDYEYILEIF